MKEIISEIVKKEQESKEKLEQAQNEARKIISEAEKQAAEIVREAKLKASHNSVEMIKKAEREFEKKKEQAIVEEKSKYEAIKKNWQPLIDNKARRVFREIIDIGHLTGKLFE
ncbi:MAG: hypothetical protein N2115_03895 [bacterium]|nr:hypothetical protein [bacterium]